jgi:ribosomal protein S18 acetylase RimI-like enzyme
MTQTISQGIVAKQGLSADDLAQIRQLADICNAYEGLNLKLNWEDLRLRTADETSDFAYYRQGALIGFLGIYIFGSQRAEISGMVHPDARRGGIFRVLLDAAQAECARRGCSEVLLICERTSRSGAAFARAMGGRLVFSEHKMELDQQARLPAVAGPVRLRRAQIADADIVARIVAISFGEAPDNAAARQSIIKDMQSELRQFFIGELDGVPIGALNLSADEADIGIYGFGVLPDQRGRGYGRQMLAQAIQEALAQHARRVTLEVETNNNSALALYQSCGFSEVANYDYYQLDR